MSTSTPLPSELALTFNAPGQVDVALSRCTQVAGLVLRRSLEPRHVLTDARISAFIQTHLGEVTQV